MSKKNLKKLDRLKNAISIEDFVIQYLNDGVLIKCRRLTHKDLKHFDISYVVTVPFEYVSSNIELVLTNKIILVIDRYGNVAPYINPNELKRLENMNIVEFQLAKLKKVKFGLYGLAKMWSDLQLLLYEKKQIDETIAILKNINLYSKLEEIGGRIYVKKYQRK